MNVTIELKPIGAVRGGRREARDDDWGTERAVIELDADRFTPEVVAGLSDFSHVEVVFHMHGVDESKVEMTARHPRNNAAWPKVGIFAQRAKGRPNRLGVSRCRIVAVDGLRVTVEGLDAIDGTPVLDLKPWMAEFGPRGQVTQPAWATELMRRYY